MRADADGLEQVADDVRELAGALRVLGHGPGRGVLDVVVGGVHELHHGVLGAHVVEALHARGVAVVDARGHAAQHAVLLAPALGTLGRGAVEVLGAHVERAGDEVAPAVGQVGVVDLLHALEGDGGVLAVGDVGHEVVAVALHAEQVDDVARGDGVAAGLAHLLGLAGLGVAHREEAVGKDVLGQGLADGHEHGRPDHAVEADDVLAHDMRLRRPTVREFGAGLVGVHAVADRRHVV